MFSLELILYKYGNQIEAGYLCNMANIITGIRIARSIALLVFPVFSPVLYALYVLAEVSDMIDVTVERKTETVIEIESKLDMAADFVLAVV